MRPALLPFRFGIYQTAGFDLLVQSLCSYGEFENNPAAVAKLEIILRAAFTAADARKEGSIDVDDFLVLYAHIKLDEIKGLKSSPQSFPLLVSCRCRRPGWQHIGEELLRRDPMAIRTANQAGVTALAAACHAGHLDVVAWCLEGI